MHSQRYPTFGKILKYFKMKKVNLTPVYLIIIIPTIIYFVYFIAIGKELSNATSDWGGFGGYISLFVAMANLYVFYKFTALIYDYNKKRDEQIDKFTRAIERPILAFKDFNEKSRPPDWKMQNVGKGAAMNVRIGIAHSPSIKNVQLIFPSYWVNHFTLAGSSDWIQISTSGDYNQLIIALYEDVEGEEYISLVSHETIYTRSRRNFEDINYQIKGQEYITKDGSLLPKVKIGVIDKIIMEKLFSV